MNSASTAKTDPQLIAWKIQPSDSGALSALLATATEQHFPQGTALEALADGMLLTWDPERTPSGAVRSAALATAEALGCAVHGTLHAPLGDRARAAIAREMLVEPHLSERSILEAAIERTWTS